MVLGQFSDYLWSANKSYGSAKTDRHDITEILLKVVLNTITQPKPIPSILIEDIKFLHQLASP
jgi:hypothetical protein